MLFSVYARLRCLAPNRNPERAPRSLKFTRNDTENNYVYEQQQRERLQWKRLVIRLAARRVHVSLSTKGRSFSKNIRKLANALCKTVYFSPTKSAQQKVVACSFSLCDHISNVEFQIRTGPSTKTEQ